jgi:hypothetical protein
MANFGMTDGALLITVIPVVTGLVLPTTGGGGGGGGGGGAPTTGQLWPRLG